MPERTVMDLIDMPTSRESLVACVEAALSSADALGEGTAAIHLNAALVALTGSGIPPALSGE